MLYFAFGSNLNRKQIKRRCKNSRFISRHILKNYQLVFRSKYGAADIQRKKGSSVLGAIYDINKADEKKLDAYEEFPKVYVKKYFKIWGKKVMFYYMSSKTKQTEPSRRYLSSIIQGYKDCGYKNSHVLVLRARRTKAR
jgi:gamma-glutamylcyclotransferase (GGCT)/AIG2-like uncharacterized protein YtfP